MQSLRFRIVFLVGRKNTDPPHHVGTLPPRRERPSCRATDNGDKFPSSHGGLKARTTPYHMLE